jgi:DNA-binding MarR family transcriptional regulator
LTNRCTNATIADVQQNERELRELTENLYAARKGMARDFLVQAIGALGQSDLTMIQMGTLMILDDGRERTVNEMASLLDRSVSATSRLVDKLVKRRLVRRAEAEGDRRVRLVAIAPAGKKLLAAVLERRAEAQLTLMARLTPEERAIVARAMSLLAEAARRGDSHEGG